MARFVAVAALAALAAWMLVACVPPDPNAPILRGPGVRPAMPPGGIEVAVQTSAVKRQDPRAAVVRAGMWTEPRAGSGSDAELSGTIHDQHGDGVPGVTIVVPLHPKGEAVEISDDHGAYHVLLPAPGAYQITVYWSDDDGTTAPIEMSEATTTHVDITMDMSNERHGEI